LRAMRRLGKGSICFTLHPLGGVVVVRIEQRLVKVGLRSVRLFHLTCRRGTGRLLLHV